MISPLVAETLRAAQERCNARFVAARRAGAQLDGPSVLAAVESFVAPAIDACEAAVPGSGAAVLDDLYDLVLTLVPQGLLGPAARRQEIGAAWIALLPPLATFVAADPRKVAGSIANAVHSLVERGGRPQDWTVLLQAAAPHCPDVDTLLRAGLVAGWRSGLPQHRFAALDVATQLPAPVAVAALGLTRGADVPATVERLRADPWLDPTKTDVAAKRRPVVVARIGAFRGFGGAFLRPPIVSVAGDRIVATDGEGTWGIWADTYGACLLRDDGAGSAAAPAAADLDPAKIDLPEVEDHASAAAVGPTVAFTAAHSHHITLVALR